MPALRHFYTTREVQRGLTLSENQIRRDGTAGLNSLVRFQQKFLVMSLQIKVTICPGLARAVLDFGGWS